MMSERQQRAICVITDYIAVSVGLLLFNILRYHFFSEILATSLGTFLRMNTVILGQVVIPPLMLLIFYLSGYYHDVIFRSRLNDFTNTFLTTLIGAFVIYFAILYNDPVEERGDLFMLLGALWGALFVTVYPPRLLLTLTMVKRIHNRRFGYKTLIIGLSSSSISLAQRLNSNSSSMGFDVIGFVSVTGYSPVTTPPYPVYDLSDLENVIRDLGVTRLIVMPHRNGMQSTMRLLNSLFPYGLPIFISADIMHMVSGRVPYNNIKGEPLINIASPAFSPSSASIKRFFDIVISVICLIVLLPFLIITAIVIKIDTRGPILYRQERIGYLKRPFKIYKFRSMKADAEENGPALSSASDPRVTRVGRFMRRYRIDELPQFVNVLRGEMSLVGPRPERQYYIDLISKQAPYFSLIHQVRPGITSLGMVKFGYASTVDEMVKRLQYDILYLENASLRMDLKIMFYTIKTVLTGKGV